MAQIEQAKNAKAFADFWAEKGDEKQESQRFWIDLLQNVLGVTAPAKYIEFEKRVQRQSLRIVNEFPAETRDDTSSDKMGAIAKEIHTNYIDAYIADTKVLIEQKGAKIDLHKAYEQSDGSVLTPFEQAKRYVGEMKASEKPRWIVVCNFREFLIYDLENPHGEPEQIFLKDLPREFYRLAFLVDQKNENIRREEEISLKAGILVGKLYDALFPQYKNPDASSFRSLNILCVRIVFCLYAEDAGLFALRTAFEDYIKSFAVENLRDGIIKLFKALDTRIADRDKYDVKLQPFPYVNGGLFKDERIEIPNFTQEIVDVIVNECAPFNWSEISPTIFGAVFESTLNPETRRKGGMHYTSIANIHKVIDPLFMDDLNAEFEAICGIRQRDVSLCRHQHDGGAMPKHDGKGAAQFDSHSERREESIDVSRSLNMTVTKKQREALLAFQQKLGSLTFLDPACGSGNFLTETYLSLRRLENRVISILNKGEKILGFDEFIKVHINQFYGIEINDFAVTVAKTALWIAESQMVAETEAILSQSIDFLPLKTAANIVEGNALRMDWATLQPLEENAMPADGLFAGFATHTDGSYHEYDYIMGNPPFVGKKEQSKTQKEELVSLFPKTVKGVGNLDYVTGWYAKAIELIRGKKTKCAFVSTNSITQGEQVPTLWKYLSGQGLSVDFAWRTFRWDSESTEKAHVHCVIVGFSNKNAVVEKKTVVVEPVETNNSAKGHFDKLNDHIKFIFDENGSKKEAAHINGYLIDAADVFIENRAKPLCDVPKIVYGSMPIDDNHLILTKEEADAVLAENPANAKFVRKYVGGDEILNGGERFCLWLLHASAKELRQSKLISARVQETKDFRSKSSRPQTLKLADTPWLFGEIRQPESQMLAVPKVSSERRRYIPISFVPPEIIVNGSALIVPDATLYEFGVLMSCVHNAWMRVVAGRMKSDYQYSGSIVYNNFPWCRLDFPSVENPNTEFSASENSRNSSAKSGTAHPCADYPVCTASQKAAIEKTAQDILDARANHAGDSLADLYDETFMPADLRRAHRENDKAVMAAYGFNTKMSESEIVSELFRMYENLTK